MITIDIVSLNEEDIRFVEHSRKAQDFAYAPYSEFKVGSAIRVEDGSYILGANQENAAYPLCLCAEQVALANTVMQKPNQLIKQIAISCSSDSRSSLPITPCGACLQVILEYEKRQHTSIEIWLVGIDKVWIASSIKEFMPFAFDGSLLK